MGVFFLVRSFYSNRGNGNINAIKYQDILEDHLWPVVAQHFSRGGYIFQDDNAPVHRARSTVTYKTHNHLPSLTWPAQSPGPMAIN